MSLFDANFAAGGVPALMDHLGESITYTPPGGVAVSLTADVSPLRREEADDFTGRNARWVREAIVATDPDGDYGGVAAPVLGAVVTIGGETYSVDHLSDLSASAARLHLTRVESRERSRPGYREPKT